MVVITRKTILRAVAIGSVAQGMAGAFFILRLDKTLDQGKFLADIVERHPEVLEEFDRIALKNLKLLKDKK